MSSSHIAVCSSLALDDTGSGAYCCKSIDIFIGVL